MINRRPPRNDANSFTITENSFPLLNLTAMRITAKCKGIQLCV